MQNINEVFKQQKLLKLIQIENFVGWVYNIDYDKAHVMTNDLWKSQSSGIPHNCFLVAATFNPERFSQTAEEEREVILLRVVGSAKLPQDDDLIRTKIDNYQDLCADYPSSRRIRRGKFDTAIRRQGVIRALQEISDGRCQSTYARRVMPYVRQRASNPHIWWAEAFS